MLHGVIATVGTLTFRTIDSARDARLAFAHQLDACVATYGDAKRCQAPLRYLEWLRGKVEEFPDGCVMAHLDHRCVGQLELHVPYGLTVGYVNLFYVVPEFRGLGYGDRLNEYAERYFRSWEARRVELHVSPINERAVRFYLRRGYTFSEPRDRGEALRLMSKVL